MFRIWSRSQYTICRNYVAVVRYVIAWLDRMQQVFTIYTERSSVGDVGYEPLQVKGSELTSFSYFVFEIVEYAACVRFGPSMKATITCTHTAVKPESEAFQ